MNTNLQPATNNSKVSNNFFRVTASDFSKIPGSPIAYWVSDAIFETFRNDSKLSNISDIKTGMQTGDNIRFLRLWPEVSVNSINIPNIELGTKRWHLYAKGGEFRRWYGNVEHILDWKDEGKPIKNLKVNGSLRSRVREMSNYLKKAVTWSFVSSSFFGCRYKEPGIFFDVAGSCALEKEKPIEEVLAFLCSKISTNLLNGLNPTLNFQIQDISNLPYKGVKVDNIVINHLISISKQDWDSFENSWNFKILPLIASKRDNETLQETYKTLRSKWQTITNEMKSHEEDNNRTFIEAYNMQNEITPEVSLNELTLTCNPYYRYGNNKSEVELENLLLTDTMKELISYAVGCIFGRYSLDKDGLILANAGEGVEAYIEAVVSDKWLVESEEGKKYESKKLSGTDSVAESYGSGRDGISGYKDISKGRAVRSDQPDTKGSSFDTLEYSRGTGSQINPGVSSFLVNCARFKSGSRDANPACPALKLCNRRYDQWDFKPGYRGNTSDQRFDEQFDIKQSNHCPLSTIHYFPDRSGILPITDENDFTDDLPSQFKTFLKASFGPEHFQENLRFVEDAIGKDIRNYFLKDFYKDHVKRYKNRPIYWMISSPSGAFRALIYLHRYTKDTIGVFLNDYLRQYKKKLDAKIKLAEQTIISGSASSSDKTKAQKDMDKINKVLKELETWERDIVYPMALKRVELDLDDGVKVNYGKLGDVLEVVKGLNG